MGKSTISMAIFNSYVSHNQMVTNYSPSATTPASSARRCRTTTCPSRALYAPCCALFPSPSARPNIWRGGHSNGDFPWETYGKPWETYGRPWEICGKLGFNDGFDWETAVLMRRTGVFLETWMGIDFTYRQWENPRRHLGPARKAQAPCWRHCPVPRKWTSLLGAPHCDGFMGR